MRLVVIRSGLQIHNMMPFPLTIAIDGFPGIPPSSSFAHIEEYDPDYTTIGRGGGQEGTLDVNQGYNWEPCAAGSIGREGGFSARIFDNIPEGGTFALPLLLANASQVTLRPSGCLYGWSQSFSCRAHTHMTFEQLQEHALEEASHRQGLGVNADGQGLGPSSKGTGLPSGGIVTQTDQGLGAPGSAASSGSAANSTPTSTVGLPGVKAAQSNSTHTAASVFSSQDVHDLVGVPLPYTNSF